MGRNSRIFLRLLTIAGASSAALLLTIAGKKAIARLVFLIETHLQRLNFTRNIFYRHFCVVNYVDGLVLRAQVIVSKTKKSNSIFLAMAARNNTYTHTRTRSRSIMMIFLSTVDTITTVFFFLHKPIDSRRKNFCCLTLAQCTRHNIHSQRSTIFVFDKNKSIEWHTTVFALTFALFFDGKTKKNEKLLKANGINVRIRVLNSRERDSLF